MINIKNGLVLVAAVMMLVSWSKPETVIRTQQEFEAALGQVSRGAEVRMKLTSGTYVVRKPLVTKGRLEMCGEGEVAVTFANAEYSRNEAVKQTATHYVCKLKASIAAFSLFVDEHDRLVKVSESVEERTGVNMTPKSIESAATPKKAGERVQIALTSNLKSIRNKRFDCAYGYFDCAWDVINFEMERSDKNWLYATTLNGSWVPNFNYEKDPYGKQIRYVVYNSEAKADGIYYDKQYIYVPKRCEKVVCVNASQKPMLEVKGGLHVKGVTFKNFNGLTIEAEARSECVFEDCHFENTPGTALSLNKKNAKRVEVAKITNCSFEHCALQKGYVVEIKSDRMRNNCVTMSGCQVARYPEGWCLYKNTLGSIACWADATIENCEVKNSPRDHLSLTSGMLVVRGCTLYNDKEFNRHQERNQSSDFGLIYVNHLYKVNKDALENRDNCVVIDGNRIYASYAYGGNGNGIFIDDGRGDVTVRNNTITDCQKYTIDSRDCPRRFGVSSCRNVFENNTLGGRYRLQGGADLSQKDAPVVKGNILLGHYKNEVKRVRVVKEDKVR